MVTVVIVCALARSGIAFPENVVMRPRCVTCTGINQTWIARHSSERQILVVEGAPCLTTGQSVFYQFTCWCRLETRHDKRHPTAGSSRHQQRTTTRCAADVPGLRDQGARASLDAAPSFCEKPQRRVPQTVILVAACVCVVSCMGNADARMSRCSPPSSCHVHGACKTASGNFVL
jgi:hypothetical protein